VVSISRVCSEQQGSYSNKDFTANYRRELRMGGDIRKKGKVKKSDGICGEDEKNT